MEVTVEIFDCVFHFFFNKFYYYAKKAITNL